MKRKAKKHNIFKICLRTVYLHLMEFFYFKYFNQKVFKNKKEVDKEPRKVCNVMLTYSMNFSVYSGHSTTAQVDLCALIS